MNSELCGHSDSQGPILSLPASRAGDRRRRQSRTHLLGESNIKTPRFAVLKTGDTDHDST